MASNTDICLQEEGEDLDGAEAEFWDEEAAEDEHRAFMDHDHTRLQWVGGPPFRVGGGMAPAGMDGGYVGATQVKQSPGRWLWNVCDLDGPKRAPCCV